MVWSDGQASLPCLRHPRERGNSRLSPQRDCTKHQSFRQGEAVMATGHDAPQAALGVRYRSSAGRWVLLVTVLGSGLVALDATVVNVALPAIGQNFGAGLSSLQWIVNAYSLTLAGLLLLGGSLGDRYGRRRHGPPCGISRRADLKLRRRGSTTWAPLSPPSVWAGWSSH